MSKFKVGDVIILKYSLRPVPRKVISITSSCYELEILNKERHTYLLDVETVDLRYESFPLYYSPLYQALKEDT